MLRKRELTLLEVTGYAFGNSWQCVVKWN